MYNIGDKVRVSVTTKIGTDDPRRKICELFCIPPIKEDLVFVGKIIRITFDSSIYLEESKHIAFNITPSPAHAPGCFYLSDITKL
jgi:hypothetical protein